MFWHLLVLCFHVVIVLSYTDWPEMQNAEESLEDIDYNFKRQRVKDKLLVFVVDKEASENSDNDSDSFPIKENFPARESDVRRMRNVKRRPPARKQKPPVKRKPYSKPTGEFRNKPMDNTDPGGPVNTEKPLGMPDIYTPFFRSPKQKLRAEQEDDLDNLDKCHVCLGSCSSLKKNMCTYYGCKDRMLKKYGQHCKQDCFNQYCRKAVEVEQDNLHDYSDENY